MAAGVLAVRDGPAPPAAGPAGLLLTVAMIPTRRRLLIAVVVGFGLPLAWWAVPGGRGFDSVGAALLMGAVMSIILAAWSTVRAKSRGAALDAGRALRAKHRDDSTGTARPGPDTSARA